MGADGVDLVDDVLHRGDPVLGESRLDNPVVGEGDSLVIDLAVASLVDELSDVLPSGVPVGDVGLHSSE